MIEMSSIQKLGLDCNAIVNYISRSFIIYEAAFSFQSKIDFFDYIFHVKFNDCFLHFDCIEGRG
jgi:hypothetical protein